MRLPKDRRGELRVGHELYKSDKEKIGLEARNVLVQYDEAMQLFDESKGVLNLTPEIIKRLHRSAIEGIYSCGGQYRTWAVKIKNSPHTPPDFKYVPGLVDEMCDRANAESDWDAVETAAFLLWRLNWIHPFGGGNGRTSRAVSYLALCIRLNMKLPGKLTIPEQLVTDRARYQAALEDADAAWKVNALDVSKMRELLNDLLRKQLAYLGGPSPSDH